MSVSIHSKKAKGKAFDLPKSVNQKKTMEKIKTFEEFSQAVEAIAGIKYFAVRMEKSKYGEHVKGVPRQIKYDYQCYIAGEKWYSGNSPEEAVQNLKQGMGLVPDVAIEAEIK